MYKRVLLDLDGTLVDSGRGITNAVMYALDKMNIPIPDRNELYRFVGPPISESFNNFFGLSGEENDRAVRLYREYYREKGLFEDEIYDGVPKLLIRLKRAGLTLILATAKPREFAERLLRHFDFFKYFDLIVGASMDASLIRKNDIIRRAVEAAADLKPYGAACGGRKSSGKPDPGENEVGATDTVMVGDRDLDILGAKAAGIDSIGVLYGYGSYEEIKNAAPTHIAKTAREVGDILLSTSS